MTVAEAQLDLLGLIGIEDPAFASPQVNTRILVDINAILQKIYTMLPPWWTTETVGELIQAPVQRTGIQVTYGSKTVTTPVAGTLPAWSLRCTIRFSGDAVDNEIASLDDTGTTFQTKLPYSGVSGSVTATIYGDCLNLDPSVAAISPPVVILGEHELIALRGQRDIQTFSPSIGHNRSPVSGQALDSYVVAEQRDVDVPIGYLVESGFNPLGQTVTALRVSPLPDKAYTLQFDKKKLPPRIQSLTPGTDLIPVPQEYAESIFLPLLRYQFTSQKQFEASGIKAYLKQQHDDAFALLSRLKPQSDRAGYVRTSQSW